MRYLLLILLSMLTSCGGTYKIEAEKPLEAEISGEAYTYVIVQLEFIGQIRELCEDLEDDTLDNYDSLVAECTFSNLSIINVGGELTAFTSEVCSNPTTAEEIQICNNLGL